MWEGWNLVLFWPPHIKPWAKTFPPSVCQPHRAPSFLLGFSVPCQCILKFHTSPSLLEMARVSLMLGQTQNLGPSGVHPRIWPWIVLSVVSGHRLIWRDVQENPGICVWILQIEAADSFRKAKPYVNSSAVPNYSALILPWRGQNVNEWVWLCFNKTLLIENRQQTGFGLWDIACWSCSRYLKSALCFKLESHKVK